jgi:hypothetical protein
MLAPVISVRHLARIKVIGIFVLLMTLTGCALTQQTVRPDVADLGRTADLIDEVKAFGQTLGIQPTAALTRVSADEKALSMLWLWLQKAGTLAVDAPLDIRMAVGFELARDQIPVEQVYRVDGYSVYYRQGNEYADPRSAATPSFAAQGIVRRVIVILQEDLHGDVNFALPWDVEEAVVTPLGALAAVEYFKRKGDSDNLQRAQEVLNEGTQIARELQQLVQEATEIFRTSSVDDAKAKILRLLPNYPSYWSTFERQTTGQHAPTVLEAKLSHDLAYFRYFDVIVSLAETPIGLDKLIAELKTLPPDSTPASAATFLQEMRAKYSAGTS